MISYPKESWQKGYSSHAVAEVSQAYPHFTGNISIFLRYSDIYLLSSLVCSISGFSGSWLLSE